jgi:hypothetical protein
MTTVNSRRRCGPSCQCAPLIRGGQGKSGEELLSVAGILVYALAGMGAGALVVAAAFLLVGLIR